MVDRRRGDGTETIRSPASYQSGVEAFEAARGGTLCVHRRHRPRDFAELTARLRAADDVMLVVCSFERDDADAFVSRPVPIRPPSLEFERDLDASFNEEEAGQLIEADVALADLKAHK